MMMKRDSSAERSEHPLRTLKEHDLKPSEILQLALNHPAALSVEAAPEVQRMGLGGWVRSQLPPQHPLLSELQSQRLALLGRHLRIRSALLPLVRAWQGDSIAVMLLKGFAHAELLYTDPSQRMYGDVDILIHETDTQRLASIARQLGWRTDGLEYEPRQWTHEVMHLLSPDGHVKLDVHRSVTARMPLAAAKVERATRAFWQEAQLVEWQGIQVWQPDPRDQLLMLALTRAWSGDGANLKPADILDYRVLQRRYAFSNEALDNRAATLGCLHTWRAFRQTLERGASDSSASAWVRQRASLDAHPLSLGQWPRRIVQVPQIAADVLKALPYALGVRRDLARGGDMRTLAAQQTVGPMHPRPHEVLPRTVRGVKWALKLVYPGGATCVPRALTTYRMLAAAGLPISFVSGVRRGETGIEGHAWTELPEQLLDEVYGEPQSAQRYREIYRHIAKRS